MTQEQEKTCEPSGRSSSALSLPVAIVFGALIIGGAVLITRNPQDTKAAVLAGAQVAPQAISLRPVSAQDHIYGSINAAVILMEYSDFECPYCSMVIPTLKKIVDSSGGKVAWVFRNLPLPETMHPEARPAAEASECVAAELGNEAYWKFSESVFSNQKDMNSAFYRKTALALGYNPAKFDNCVAKKTYDKRIDDDSSEANSNGGNGTPFTIVIGKNGKVPLSGAVPEKDFQAAIQKVQ